MTLPIDDQYSLSPYERATLLIEQSRALLDQSYQRCERSAQSVIGIQWTMAALRDTQARRASAFRSEHTAPTLHAESPPAHKVSPRLNRGRRPTG